MKTCPSCRIGRLSERLMTYLEWHGRNLMVANRMPALVCDVCGEQVYDDHAMDNLQQLLWSEPLRGTASVSNSNSR
ncbi:MAG TPA: YgiT-type zinc finger protein [Anaerolineae bacterium]|nr:YgiT-type zinc finger protein [Anaerolineae bacterium]